MDGNTNRRARTLAWAAGLVAAGAVAGGVAAATLPASADTTPTPSATAPGTTDGGTARPHGFGGQRPGETVLTGTNAAKAKAAALKALPGATIDRLETDADGAVYEAHMTKADGSRATVKMDKNFAVTGIEAGMGRGGPGAPGTAGTSNTGSTA